VLRAGTTTIKTADGPHVVNRYLLKNGAAQAVVYYWYQGRGRVVASEYTVKWDLLRDAAIEGHTEEALVRLIVPVAPADSTQAHADQLAQEVAPRLLNDVAQVLPGERAILKTASF
jgi:EpsI family protein